MDLERLAAALAPVEVVGRCAVEVTDLAYDARALARDAEEDAASFDGAGVVGEIRHLDYAPADDLDRRERGGQTLEIHRG